VKASISHSFVLAILPKVELIFVLMKMLVANNLIERKRYLRMGWFIAVLMLFYGKL